ncbi:alpha/beta fold hydrolase [Streptomyces diastatochromogenes]|uniref:alpha/beta fold hydrolase n=1 Tax=Streptomyces diastatochromogenes TaxID=42236 RepID=UPI003689F94A
MSSAGDRVRRRTVRAGGLEVPILEAGSGPLVLCLHGFPDHAASWAGLLDRLAQDGYWAVAPAQRGYWPGGAAPDGSYRASATGQDVLALIEALGRERADLVGHDLGARAAYAAANLDPARVRRLVGMSVPYGPGLRTAWLADGDQQRRSWYMFFFQTALANRPSSSTTSPSSTGCGENGHPATNCRMRSVPRSRKLSAGRES